MTTLIGTRPRSGSRRQPPLAPAAVDVLICGSIDRGDDGAPFVAADMVERALRRSVQIRRVGQLDVDDLLSIRHGAGVVIVDAATGIEPGDVQELPLRGLAQPAAAVRPRSSHALTLPEVIGLADMLRGRPLVGRIVVIGARRFAFGKPLTRRVARAIPTFVQAITTAVERVGGETGAEA